MNKKIKLIIDKIEKIPTLPPVINQIIAVLNNPKSSADDVNRAILTDIALSAKVLKLVNSSYFGLSKKVSSITQAIVILGFNTIQSLALTASIMSLFSHNENPKMKRADFWDHSFAVALVSKLIAKHLKVPLKDLETYFISGLFHDIGKVVLDQYLHEEFDAVLELASLEGQSIYEAEKHILGISHSDIGKYITEKWKLPDIIIESIRYHHTPQLSTTAQQIATVVYLSNFLCKAKRIGNSGDYNISNFQEQIVTKYNITPDFIKTLLMTIIDKEIEAAKSMFKIIKN